MTPQEAVAKYLLSKGWGLIGTYADGVIFVNGPIHATTAQTELRFENIRNDEKQIVDYADPELLDIIDTRSKIIRKWTDKKPEKCTTPLD